MSRYVSATLRKLIDERDLGLCRYCGCIPQIKEYDHVIPYSSGGLTDISNLVLACFECNRDKSDATWVPIPIGQTWGPDQRFREKPPKNRNFFNEEKPIVLGSSEQSVEKSNPKEFSPIGKNNSVTQQLNRLKAKGPKGSAFSKRKQAEHKAKLKEQNDARAKIPYAKFCYICKIIGANLIDNEGRFLHKECQ